MKLTGIKKQICERCKTEVKVGNLKGKVIVYCRCHKYICGSGIENYTNAQRYI